MALLSKQYQDEEGWLTCRVDKGMFSDEAAVTYPAEGEKKKSVFVNSSVVRHGDGKPAQVRVRILRRNGNVVAILPSENRDVVSVDARDITS